MRTKIFIILGAVAIAFVLFGALDQLTKNLHTDLSSVLENR